MPLAIAQVLGERYRIDALLGAGGMGAVYRAYDTRLQQAVAIKENTMAAPGISPEAADAARKQFEREALVLARLRHPNLPRVGDHFVTPDGNQYLVMDFIEGWDLAQVMARTGPLPEAQAVAWISQVCDALEYLHRQQPPIIHRDIKPQNIKVTSQGQVYLVDFGIAKIGEVSSKTATGALGVTPGFSPPEQYTMTGTDARSDVYALGATLYALLTGQMPPESISLQSGEARLVPLRQANKTVSPAAQMAVIRAMQTRRTDRPSVAEFRQMLTAKNMERAAKSVEPVERPLVPLEKTKSRLSAAADNARPDVVTPQAAQPPSKSHLEQERSALVPVAILVGLLAFGVVIFLVICPAMGTATTQAPTTVATTVPATAAAQAQAQATAAARTQATATAQAQVTATAQAQVAATAQAQASATAQVAQTAATALAKQAKRLYGPADGGLDHKEDDTLKGEFAGVNLTNFIADVQFYNPYDAGQHPWDCGFVFRYTGFYGQYRLSIDSDGRWSLRLAATLADNRPQSSEVASGKLGSVSLAANGLNHLRLVVNGRTAHFFVNDEYVATLDVSGKIASGDVGVAIGYDHGREINGRTTRYKSFTVWALP